MPNGTPTLNGGKVVGEGTGTARRWRQAAWPASDGRGEPVRARPAVRFSPRPYKFEIVDARRKGDREGRVTVDRHARCRCEGRTEERSRRKKNPPQIDRRLRTQISRRQNKNNPQNQTPPKTTSNPPQNQKWTNECRTVCRDVCLAVFNLCPLAICAPPPPPTTAPPQNGFSYYPLFPLSPPSRNPSPPIRGRGRRTAATPASGAHRQHRRQRRRPEKPAILWVKAKSTRPLLSPSPGDR